MSSTTNSSSQIDALAALSNISPLLFDTLKRSRKLPLFVGSSSEAESISLLGKYLLYVIFVDKSLQSNNVVIHASDFDDIEHVLSQSGNMAEKVKMACISNYFVSQSSIAGKPLDVSWYGIPAIGDFIVGDGDRVTVSQRIGSVSSRMCQICFGKPVKDYRCSKCNLPFCATCILKSSLQTGFCPTHGCGEEFNFRTYLRKHSSPKTDAKLILGEHHFRSSLIRRNTSQFMDIVRAYNVAYDTAAARAFVQGPAVKVQYCTLRGTILNCDAFTRAKSRSIEVEHSQFFSLANYVCDLLIGGNGAYLQRMGFNFPEYYAQNGHDETINLTGGRLLWEINETTNLLESIPKMPIFRQKIFDLNSQTHVPAQFEEMVTVWNYSAPIQDRITDVKACYKSYIQVLRAEAELDALFKESGLTFDRILQEVKRVGRFGPAKFEEEQANLLHCIRSNGGIANTCPRCKAVCMLQEGCNQVFCEYNGCNTLFDINSGELITKGFIHNDRYFAAVDSGSIRRVGSASKPFLADLSKITLNNIRQKLVFAAPKILSRSDIIKRFTQEFSVLKHKESERFARAIYEQIQEICSDPSITQEDAVSKIRSLADFVSREPDYLNSKKTSFVVDLLDIASEIENPSPVKARKLTRLPVQRRKVSSDDSDSEDDDDLFSATGQLNQWVAVTNSAPAAQASDDSSSDETDGIASRIIARRNEPVVQKVPAARTSPGRAPARASGPKKVPQAPVQVRNSGWGEVPQAPVQVLTSGWGQVPQAPIQAWGEVPQEQTPPVLHESIPTEPNPEDSPIPAARVSAPPPAESEEEVPVKKPAPAAKKGLAKFLKKKK